MNRLLPLALIIAFVFGCQSDPQSGIDRLKLVNRHLVVITEPDSLNSLTVGNGEFAFTVDITGLQTFPEYHVSGIPLGTFSNWCWHSDPNTEGYVPAKTLKYFQVGGRRIGYYYGYGTEEDPEKAKASDYLRQNPHRMNMGMVGLKILDKKGQRISPDQIQRAEQVLDLWKGEIRSYFEIEGIPVLVTTLSHPEEGMVACSIDTELFQSGQLVVEIRFPEADRGWKNTNLWGMDEHHESRIIESDSGRAILLHRQDNTTYLAGLNYTPATLTQSGIHTYALNPLEGSSNLNFTCEFEESRDGLLGSPEFEGVRQLASADWEHYWTTGGAVDFSACEDSRAPELERRVVLSQYLTRINCSGSLPPQETGLTYNSWFGKMHLEMHWWHGVHFALWGREQILEKQMQYYRDIRDQAEDLARIQGFQGVRWPKMVGPEGMTSPSNVGNFLIWQQPHYIYFAEMLYQLSSDKAWVQELYGDLVSATADFMASYPVYEPRQGRFVLGPALIPAQETFRPETTINPSFELVYWYWALGRAIEWKIREGSPVPASWTEVMEKLSDLPVSDSAYLFTEDGTDSYDNERYVSDHPAVLGCLGMLPETDMVDRVIMRNTFDKVVERWNWPHTWGWDYPLVAMCAAELGLYDQAIHYLMLDVQKNTYLPNGHNYQDGRLTLYLPGNGGLLTTVARMCTREQFPKDGNWEVRWENLNDF